MSAVSAVPRGVCVGYEFLTVAVSREVEDAIREWTIAHRDDLAARLERFGLGPYDLVEPGFRRLVRREELADV